MAMIMIITIVLLIQDSQQDSISAYSVIKKIDTFKLAHLLKT